MHKLKRQRSTLLHSITNCSNHTSSVIRFFKSHSNSLPMLQSGPTCEASDGQLTPAAVSLPNRLWEWAVKKRVFLTAALVTILVVEDILAGESPHLLWSYHQDIRGSIGLVLIGVGLFVRSWAAGTLLKDTMLCTTGPYAMIRNPLYLGSALMMVGFCSLIGDWDNCLLLSVVGVLIYWPKIKKEESLLSTLFGVQWSQYAQRTPRIMPTSLQLRSAFTHWSWKRWLANREYKAILGTLMGLVAIEIWHLLRGRNM